VAEYLTRKIPLGVSACVDRCPVRYNGKAFDGLAVIGRERSDYVLTPVCPECSAGFGVPREPIHLTGAGAEVLAGRAEVRTRHGRDVTGEVVAGARTCLQILERAGARVVILKEASPSCGVFHAKIGKSRRQQTQGAGVFGAMILGRGWFVIPDTALGSPLRWWDQRRRMHAWLWLTDRPVATKADLYDTWHTLKFMVQELDRPFADRLGHELAELPARVDAHCVERYRAEMLGVLGRPSTAPRIRQALFKTYTHYRKRGDLRGVDLHGLEVPEPGQPDPATAVAQRLIQLERVSFESDILFGTSPVVFRDERRVRAHEHERATLRDKE
jgi:uncharacterized protein YbbK (DUF523 family)